MITISVRLERTTTTTTSLYVPGGPEAGGGGSRLTKLVLERTITNESSDLYLTPNCTLTAPPPDLIPRLSPAADEYRTPDSTLIENGHDTFAMPTYFDRKRQPAVSLAAEPLANFHVLKQKSLNTIPALALLDRSRKADELFNNFPFLTPLAHRKNSLVSAVKLSGCIEDEFYCIPSEPETEPGSTERVDVRCRLRSLSSRALRGGSPPPPPPAFGATSTPKSEEVPLQRHSYTGHVRYAPRPSAFYFTAACIVHAY